ncbi:MAG: hypothetical protein ACI4F3_02620 [Enterocloster sp.]
MKRRNKVHKMAAFLAAVILTTLCFCQAVFAAESAGIDPARPITLKIDLEEKTQSATIAVYKVGEWDGSKGEYVLTEEFAPSKADITDATTDGVIKASETLEKYVQEKGLKEIAVQSTTDGVIQFTGLSNGLYLICQKIASSDNVTVTPFITTLPVMDQTSHTWNYNVASVPKHSPIPKPVSPGGGSSGGGGGGSSGGHKATINTNPIPQASAPEIVIPDPEVPLIGLPKMGDAGVAGYAIGMAAALVIAGGALYIRKRLSRS